MFVSNKRSKMTNIFVDCLTKAFDEGKIDSPMASIEYYEYKNDADHCGLDERLDFTTNSGKKYSVTYRHNSGHPINIRVK